MFIGKEFVGGIGVRGIGEAGMRTRRKKRRGRTMRRRDMEMDRAVMRKIWTGMARMMRLRTTTSGKLRLINFGMLGPTAGLTTTITMTPIFEDGKERMEMEESLVETQRGKLPQYQRRPQGRTKDKEKTTTTNTNNSNGNDR
jgi:hypothetical protein